MGLMLKTTVGVSIHSPDLVEGPRIPLTVIFQVLDELGRKSALGAVANAEERAYAPRCLHETRAKVLNDLEKWSADEGQWKDAKMLVLTGPAGHGKTAIMQSFSEQLLEKSSTTHLVVVTFFFRPRFQSRTSLRRW